MARAGSSILLLLGVAWPAMALAAERQATIQGVDNPALRAEIDQAVGEVKAPSANRVEARRRARNAADSAVALLRSEGYYDYDVQPDIGEGDHPQAVVKIDPGPRSHLKAGAIDWVGAPPAPDAEAAAEKAMGLKPGAPARAIDIIAAEGRVLSAVQQLGYADAKVEPRQVVVDHDDQSVTPTFKLASGGPVRLGALKIDAKGRTREAFIRKLRPWKAGAIYKPDSVAELERRLLDTQAYDSVTVALAPKADPDGLRPVIISLADRPPHALEIAAGYSTTEGADVDLKLAQYNRLGRADTLTYEVRYGDIDSRIGPTLALPDFWSPGQTLTTSADIFRTTATAYTETGVQIAGDLTQRYGKTSFFTRGISLTGSTVDDKETGTINILTGKLLGAFALDRSDNPLDPRRGYKLEARAEPTVITGDESLVYLKLQAQASYYFPIDVAANNVIAARLKLGSILGGDVPGVPASDRFYAGGGGSVRGYEYQTVGPHYPDNNPVGGVSLAEASIEFRHQFTKTIGGVLFVDSGTVGEQIQPDFRHGDTAVGVGFRYNLGFAPVRADLAFPLQKPNGSSQQPFQIYLSIGQSF